MQVGDLVYCSRDPFESAKALGIITSFHKDSDGDIIYVVVRFLDGIEEYFHPTGIELIPREG